MPGRLAKLEGAISKQRTVKFDYWSISRDVESERTLNPYALLPDNGVWYVVGHDLDRDDIRTFRVSRIRGEIKFATRRERDFRIPADFDIEDFRGRAAVADRRHRRRGAHRGAAATPPGGCSASYGATRPARGRRLRHRVLVARRSSPRGCCARTAAPCRSSRRSCAARSPTCPAPRARRPRGPPAGARRARPRVRGVDAAAERPAGPGRAGALRACSSRCSPTCSPPAARRREAAIPARRAARALPVHPGRGARGAPLAAQPRQLRRRLLRGLRRAPRRRRCTSTRSCAATPSGCRRG